MATRRRKQEGKKKRPAARGGSRRMGEGTNFGKGQQRRMSGKKLTRKPQVLGVKGEQELASVGGEPERRRRGAGLMRDVGGTPTNERPQGSERAEDRLLGEDLADDALGF